MYEQRTNMYRFVVDIFFEKLKKLEQIVSVEIGVSLKCALQNYGKFAEVAKDEVP